MKNKTCGECKYYKPYNEKICLYVHRTCVSPKTKACNSFAKTTNGDLIRQGGDKDLYLYKKRWDCSVCAYFFQQKTPFRTVCKCPKGKMCVDGMIAWLNAPADAPDTNVDTKESEVKNG